MSVLIQSLKTTGKAYSFRKSIHGYRSIYKNLISRKYSDSLIKFKTFDEVVAQRRLEAKRSLVVQVSSEASFSELYGYCSKYAEINGIHHYKNSGDEHFMLIEFKSEDNLKDVLKTCSSHQKEVDVMAVQSPFLWFRALPGKKLNATSISNISLATNEGNTVVDNEKLYEELTNCETVSHQIQLLYDRTVLNDLGVRLRFMVARQLEVVLESLYSNVLVQPFGSSVNGFGKMGCDLDLVLSNDVTSDMELEQKRLVYQEKKCEGGRSPWLRHMELVAEALELRVAGAARVLRILNARVPIVKYSHELAAVECDLCYSNLSGVYMSELLWLYGSLDPRVRPLAFVARRWAAASGITREHPGRWLTNFPLTLMVLFFLMQRSDGAAVLPPFKSLVRRAGKDDIRVAEDNLNCTFLRDLNKLPQNYYGQNQDNLETLLLQFFEFYSQFDFREKGISINEGTAVRNTNGLPLYIVNPLSKTLNVSRNVSFEECEKIKLEVRNAAWQLETVAENGKSEDWGILGLIESKATRGLKRLLRVGNSQRILTVKDLFKEDSLNQPCDNELRTKLEKLSGKSDKEVEKSLQEVKEALNKVDRSDPRNMKFKNRSVANAVHRLRRNKMV